MGRARTRGARRVMLVAGRETRPRALKRITGLSVRLAQHRRRAVARAFRRSNH